MERQSQLSATLVTAAQLCKDVRAGLEVVYMLRLLCPCLSESSAALTLYGCTVALQPSVCVER